MGLEDWDVEFEGEDMTGPKENLWVFAFHSAQILLGRAVAGVTVCPEQQGFRDGTRQAGKLQVCAGVDWGQGTGKHSGVF